MFRKLFVFVIGATVLVMAGTAAADWIPGDGHKMHWPQLPDEQGWDVNATFPANLADDWQCTESGPVLDFHFWGSWKDFDGDGVGDVGQIQFFTIRIWSDIPVDPPSIMYSRPGTLLWEMDVDGWVPVPIDPPTIEHWYDPFLSEVVNNDHGEYFQYNIDLRTMPGVVPFDQVAGRIYWLGITAHVAQGPVPTQWGWKSTIDHFNDDATFAQEGDWAGWRDMYEPPRYNEFDVALDLGGVFAGGGGTNFYTDGTDQNGWYYYPQFNWWNIWFYDNPLRFDNYKEAFINGQVLPIDPAQPSQVTIAVNFSTDLWSEQGLGRPPLPSDPDENLNIGRVIIWSWSPTQGPLPPTGVLLEEFWTFTDYNPEWISIDVQGFNFRLQGNMTHECVQTSLDLAFVITGDNAPTGACCWDDGTCTIELQAVCEDPANPLLGTYMGDGTVCLGDSDGDGNDDLCVPVPTGACCHPDGTCTIETQADCTSAAIAGTYMGDGTICLGDSDGDGNDDLCVPVPTGACCHPDGTCTIETQADCTSAAIAGTYMGDGSVCLGDSDGDGNDDLCVPPVTGACCFTDGSCQDLTQNACQSVGGVYQGDGTACLGDVNPANGVDDACETPTDEEKWHQHPDLGTGDDVNATYHPDIPPPGIPPYLLADDFQCVQTGPITRIHVYGSWYLDRIPVDDPHNVRFVLSIHEDIPDPDGPAGPGYSMPGALVCLIDNPPFTAVPFATNLHEGWLEPPDYWTPFPQGDAICWLYMFDVSDFGCIQTGTVDNPKVYWLDVQAYPQGDVDAWFGWKTTLEHWNDDAVWANAVDDGTSSINWGELHFPSNHEFYPGVSVDLAFTIFGQAGTPPTGACCYEDGTCVDGMTAADCAASGGDYGGDGTVCAGTDGNGNGIDDFCDNIVTLGACCYGNSLAPSCVNTTQTLCEAAGGFAGTWYAGQDCNDAGFQCPVAGACCYEDAAAGWQCIITNTQADCVSLPNGTWYEGQPCASIECPPPDPMGACCWEDAGFVYCANTTEDDCLNNYTNGTWYAGQTCISFDCPTTPRGACCWPDGTCTVETQADCQSAGAAPGVYKGDGSVCLGDGDGNGVDDACEEGPGFKWMHPPDLTPEGVDVRFTEPVTLADDFLCIVPGEIQEVSIWVSWFHDEWPQGDPGAVQFRLGLYTDIPDPDDSGPMWSMPGDVVCYRQFLPGEFLVEQVTADAPEGWYDPWVDHYEWPGDNNCFKITFNWAPGECMQEGTETDPIVYWLVVEAEVLSTQEMYIGWKTSMQHWNDDATWIEFPGPEPPVGSAWRELRYPPQHPFTPESIDLAFEIIGGTTIGACCFDDGTCMVMSAARCNEHMGTYLGNNTICEGDTDGNGVDDACESPPLGACCLLNGACIVTDLNNCSKQHGTYLGDGVPCEGDADANGIDDACEDPPFGACCLVDGTCVEITAIDCEKRNGNYQGDGTQCQGDADGNGVDDACEAPPMGACCLPTGQCYVMTATHCAAYQGQYLGDNVPCEGDADFNGIDDACEPPVGACCWPDGTCSLVTQSECENPIGIPAGIYKGDGTVCHGDADLNGVDDGCEGPVTESKWEQPPDLSTLGMDVYATESIDYIPGLLADDFECTEASPILEIHVWGSWLMNAYPVGGPGSVPITLSLHTDIPDPDGSGPLYSQPGNLLWNRTFAPGEYTVEPYLISNLTEGFLLPWAPNWLPGFDHNCWLYKFKLNPGEFVQEGTLTNPVVYWLDVQARGVQAKRYFGWKTTTEHWNDDGVWAQGTDDGIFTPWYELVYTWDHPYAGQSIDLAFRILGEAATSCCVGRVGDANAVGGDEPTIGDVSVMIDALFISGLMSKIACIPEADVNQSGGPNPGTVDITIGDVSMLIDYLFISGAYDPITNPSGVILGDCF